MARLNTANGYIAQWLERLTADQQPWFKSGCALCFHDGLSLQGLRLMLTKRVEGWSGASLRFQLCCAELSCGGLTGIQCPMLCGPKT